MGIDVLLTQALFEGENSVAGRIGKAGENIYKTYSGEYERERVAAQKESNAAMQRKADIEAQRARLAQIREARIRRAQVLASTGVTGTGTSGTAGATASITSQTAANINAIDVNQQLSAQASAANQRAADASSNMALGQTYGQLVGTIFNQQGGFTTIFGGNTHKKAGS